MDKSTLEKAIVAKKNMTYQSQFNSFWQWKLDVETKGESHVLDEEHIATTCTELLKILPGWQTWRGNRCDYRENFPIALHNIANYYSQIKKYNILDFEQIPEDALKGIWDELGRVKETDGRIRPKGDYFIISVCKPLMFLWGQTLPFDSKNRKHLKRDSSLSGKIYISRNTRWQYAEWKNAIITLKNQLFEDVEMTQYIKQKSSELYNSKSTIPYGRFIDICYF